MKHAIHAQAWELCWKGPWLSGSHQTVPVLGVLTVQGYAFPEAGSSVYGAELEVRSAQRMCTLAWHTQGSCSAQVNPVLGSETSRQRRAGAHSPLIPICAVVTTDRALSTSHFCNCGLISHAGLTLLGAMATLTSSSCRFGRAPGARAAGGDRAYVVGEKGFEPCLSL